MLAEQTLRRPLWHTAGVIDTRRRHALAAKRSAGSENPGWRRVAPYPGYAVVPLLCRYFAGWRLRLTRPTKTGPPVLFWWHAPGPRLRSAAGLLLRLLLRLRQLADDRLAPHIPFRQPGQ